MLFANFKTKQILRQLTNQYFCMMYTTYHFSSAADMGAEVLEAIRAAYREKPIVVTVEEEVDETAFLMNNPANKAMLLRSIAQDKNGESISFTIPTEEV